MMDAIVQLIRNALCCVKDLKLFESTFIHNAEYTNRYLDSLTSPLNKTTPLEVIISITQLYACLSNTKSGLTLLTSSIGKLRLIIGLIESRMTKTGIVSHADRIINESLMKEAFAAIKSIFVGLLVAPIGIAFWWLFINSWHITEVDWFGGLPALIHALEVMELCLLPLLYFMIVDGLATLAKSKKHLDIRIGINDKMLKASTMKLETYESMTGWTPFWASGVSLFSGDKEVEKKFAEELDTVKKQLAIWFPSNSDKKKDENVVKISEEALDEAGDRLMPSVDKLRMEGYREFLYFVFNFVAFYGYLMAPLTFYYDDEETQPDYIQAMKFYNSNADADWTGNFAGDFMWTIEPIVILCSPFVISRLAPKGKKVKTD